ncbi:MAG: carbohydrate kinase family protein [Patescibacteria group bacterium]|jgi:adenosine kinase
MTRRVYIEGSLAYDRIFSFPGQFAKHIDPKKLHVLSLSFAVERAYERRGGTAGNIAYSLSLLGKRSYLLGVVGNDFAPYRAWLTAQGISMQYVEIMKDDLTAQANIFTDRDDNQLAGFVIGAMMQPLRKALPIFKKHDIIHIAPGNKTDMLRIARAAAKRAVPYIFDPGQQLPTFHTTELRRMISGAGMVIVNDYELGLLLKHAKLSRMALLGKVGTLVTTFGPHGSEFASRKNLMRIPAVRVAKAVDPTGAGDAYRAGLIYGLLEDFAPEKLGRLAATVAAYAVEKHGTQEHHFTFAALQRRYKQQFKTSL